MNVWKYCLVILGLCLTGSQALAQQKFADLVGPVKVQPVKKAAQIDVPFITWGGDVATFLANGGLTTQKGTIFAKQGLNLKLVNGDDFVQQVRNYMSGRTPFLRGTFRMLGQASEVIGSSPATKPVIVLQLTWSQGDHVVARGHIKTLNDLMPKSGKKVKIACQQGGPHVGLIDDMLHSVPRPEDVTKTLDWNDVEIVWTSDLSGENGPAEKFRKDPSVDACCVITPDMMGLTGGLESTGTGAEGTVKGARVLLSTAQMSRSIADVYAVRSDWFRANRGSVEKFVAGYLKAAQEVVPMRRDYEVSGRKAASFAQYRGLLETAQRIFGKEVIPNPLVDGHGLLLDCTYVGLGGNISFFRDLGNLNGFRPKLEAALDLAVRQGYATERREFVAADFDYDKVAALVGIKRERRAEGFKPPDQWGPKDEIFSFTVQCAPNEPIPEEIKTDVLVRAIQSASTFGNAAIVVRGHVDPTKTLMDLVNEGMTKGVLRRTGQPPNYEYYVRTERGTAKLDLEQTGAVVELIRTGKMFGEARLTMQAALTLSEARAKYVQKLIGDYAQQHKINLNVSQIQTEGVGIREPLIPKPRNMGEARKNMRVEFRIVKREVEATEGLDFNF